MRNPRIWLLVCWLCCGWAMAQPPRYFRHFTERDGLSDNRVQAIAQDSAGFIWIGTANGLNRYDGIRFETYLPDAHHPGTSIQQAGIHDLDVDAQGKLWIATESGLECRDPKTGTFRRWVPQGRNDGSLPSATVTSLHFDAGGRLWIACDNRDLCRYDPQQDRFFTYPWRAFVQQQYPETAPDAYLTIYYLKARGTTGLWLHTNVGLYGFDGITGTFDHVPMPAQVPVLTRLGDCKEALLAGSWNHDLLRLDPCARTWARLLLPARAGATAGEHVPDVHRYRNGWLVCSRFGVDWLPDHATQIQALIPIEDARPSTPTGRITEALTDRAGGLWIGGEQGLWLAEPLQRQFHYQPMRTSTIVDNYNCYTRFLELESGELLALNYYYHVLQRFGGDGGKSVTLAGKPGLLRREPVGRMPISSPVPGKPGHPSPAGATAPQTGAHQPLTGRIWLGVGNRLFTCDPSTLALKDLPIHAPNWSVPAKGNFEAVEWDWQARAWIGHTEGGLLVYDPATDSWWHPDSTSGFISQSVSSIEVDLPRQCIWIGTNDYGLFRYTPDGKFRLYQHDPAHPRTTLAAYLVSDLHLDAQGRLWVATDPGGVSVMFPDAPDGQNFYNIGVEQGLPSGRTTGLCADSHGRIWATTLGGLVCIDPVQRQVTAFTEADGLPQDMLDLPPHPLRDGSILIGLKYGYVRFHPDSLLMDRPGEGIFLREVQVLDSTRVGQMADAFSGGLELDWRQDFLRFRWSGVDVLGARRTRFQHRLAGFDGRWIDSGPEAEAQFTRVPPGEYVFEVRSGQGGSWNAAGLRLPIRIWPPYWETWWFRLAVALAVAALLFTAYRLRLRQVRREARLRADFEQQLARTEMAALRAQMNPHFVFNCLSSINRYILVNQPDEASAYLTKFARLIRLILDNSRTETVVLSRELEALRLYVELEQMRFDQKFSYHVTIDPSLQPEHLEVPPLLIQPYLENAIWHGLMHKEGLGKLQLRILRHGSEGLRIEVEDDGIGRARAMELKSRSATVQKSHGMKVTHERLEAINRLYGTKATVQTIDLHSADGHPAGTRIIIEL